MVLYGFIDAYDSCGTLTFAAACLRAAAVKFHPEKMDTFTDRNDLEGKVKQDKRALVLFCASWCPFCRGFFPTFDRLTLKHSFDKVLRVYIDDDDNPLWEDYSIESVPTMLLFERGKATRRLDAKLGFGLSEKQFTEWLKKT
jgi:thioredoxin 1